MDLIAKRIDCSKGTIYQHFANKEDLIMALVCENLEIRCQLFERAAGWEGNTRERILGIGVADHIFVETYPEHTESERMFKIASFMDKTSQGNRERMIALDERCTEIILDVIREGVACGDLHLQEGQSVDSVLFGLWAIADGTRQIYDGCKSHKLDQLPPIKKILETNFSVLLDGYDWGPLSHEHDYREAEGRIAEYLCCAECFEKVANQA